MSTTFEVAQRLWFMAVVMLVAGVVMVFTPSLAAKVFLFVGVTLGIGGPALMLIERNRERERIEKEFEFRGGLV